MNNSKITNLNISLSVKKAVKEKHGTVRTCANAFNLRHSEEIENSGWRKMDKDFIQRICTNKFSVVTPRVSNLCDFLEVNLEIQPTPTRSALTKEFDILERVVRHHPDLEKTLRELLSNVANVLTLNGAKDFS